MRDSKGAVRARERRWAVPVGIASILAVVLMIAARPLNVRGDGRADLLREVDAHSGQVLLSGLIQVVAFLPLVYLFRAVAARSDRVRPQLLGLMVAAPLFLAISSGLTIVVTNEGADNFLAGKADPSLTPAEAREECAEEKQDEGADFLVEEYDPAKGESPLRACEDRKLENDEATEAIGEAALTPVAAGFGIAGVFGLVVGLLYLGLWAMRTGLLSRFWGALGMVSGIAFLLRPLSFVAMVFFVYFGLLALGLVPRGRPPAWAAGEAIPWPTPGERAAAEMEPEGGWDEEDETGEGEERATPPDRR